jgi:hypothetical protein
MSNRELDIYLESIGGLINGWTGDRILSSDFFDTSIGWNQLIKDLIEDIIELGWNKEVCQVKEKFGGLRFYINESSDEVFKRIGEAEEKSYTVCEVTGEPGKLRRDIGWIRTLSDEEYSKIKNSLNSR